MSPPSFSSCSPRCAMISCSGCRVAPWLVDHFFQIEGFLRRVPSPLRHAADVRDSGGVGVKEYEYGGIGTAN